MPSEPNRRFLGLDVDEVSLVDEPANLTPFLVLKALEATPMADKQTAAAPESATSVEVEQTEAAGGDAVTKALAHVDSIVDKVTKAVKGDQPAASTPAAAAESAPAEPEETDTEKGMGPMSFKQMMEKAGMTGDALKSAMANFEKATGLKGDMKFNAQPPVAKTTKATEGEGGEAAAAPEVVPEVLTLEGLAAAVTKAAAFTPSRIAQLQQAQEILKLILTGIAPGQSPATSTPAVMTHPNPNTSAALTKPAPQASVSKSADGGDGTEVVEALKSLGDLIKDFGGRLNAVEKARPAGNSTQPDETHSKEEPVQKAFWAGVL